VNKRKALIMGKPSVYGLHRIIKDHHSHRTDEEHIKDIKRSFLMIGDNLVTDI
jgi:ribonucleotide monophosphatase NagD (HAD superfamily)